MPGGGASLERGETVTQPSLYQYFEDELAYLASAGARFARRHPERAALVSLDNVTSRDPDVERLVQAFAFLAGQVRGELHDELPQITHTLLDLLWPHYLRSTPATAVVEFRPDLHQAAGPIRLGAGETYVESAPVQPVADSRRLVVCRFRTAYDTTLLPVRLVNVAVRRHATHCELALQLEVGLNADPTQVWDVLRLHFAGDAVVALDARYWLLRFATQGVQADVQPPGGRVQTFRLPNLQSVGFLPDQGLFPSGRISFPGYRLVQEYFLAKHKFLYADVVGLDRLGPIEPQSKVVLRIPLDEFPPERLKLGTDAIRLHCAPVVNLFRHSAEPIRYDGRQVEYEIVAEPHPQSMAIHQVHSVYGQPPGETTGRDYPNFLDFRTNPDRDEACFHVSIRPGVDGEPTWRLMLVKPKGVVPPQTLTIDVECSNGDVAPALLPGDIRFRGEGVPDLVEVRSLTRPEPMYRPPLESASPWRFVSHLATNYLSLEDVGTLVGVLKLYDWTPNHANWRRLEGIRALHSTPGSTVIDGIPLRGRNIEVELDATCFANVGDAYLFSEVLNHFLALYANVNTYTRLTSRLTTGEVFQWPALNGRQRPI